MSNQSKTFNYISTFNPGVSSSTQSTISFQPVAISRQNIQVGSETRTQVLQVSMPNSHPLAQVYANNLPATPGTLSIYRLQALDSTNFAQPMFYGTIKSVTYNDAGGMTDVGVFPVSQNLERQLPRFIFQSNCNHVLYDSGCTVNSTAFVYASTVTSTNESLVTVAGISAAKGTGWAISGFAFHNGNYRLVVGQSTDTLQLILPFFENVSTQTISTFAGCDHSLGTCNVKFTNGINFLGFIQVPTSNPFVSGINDNL